MSQALARGEVRIWWATPDSVADDVLATQRELLSTGEQAAVSRLRSERERKRALLARVLVRRALAEVEGGLAPAEWRFAKTALGRPTIANPSFDWLNFNVSHTGDLVVCAVGKQPQLGIDVEAIVGSAPLGIVDTCLAPGEAADVRNATPDVRSRRFFEYWTLKEAFVKALGQGLAVPLQSFWFSLRPERIALTVAVELAETVKDPDRWQFALRDIAPGHLLALASADEAGGPCQVNLQPFSKLLAQ